MGGGAFGPLAAHALRNSSFAIAAGALDADATVDVALALGAPGFLATAMNDGSASFTVAPTQPLSDLPTSIITGDFDDDGDLDVALSVAGLANTTEALALAREAQLGYADAGPRHAARTAAVEAWLREH